jgi:hypothetical protein
MKLVWNFAECIKGRADRVTARRFVLLMAAFAVTNLGTFAQPAPGLSAHWEGTIQMPERDVHLTLDLAKNSKGEWRGSFSVPASDIIDAPLTGISVKDTSMRFGLGLSNTSFDGTLSEDRGTLAGTATSEKGSAPFQLKRNGEANVKLPSPSTPLTKDFEGAWEGTLEIPTGPLRAMLNLTRASDGTATGTLISVDQGGQEFSITTITQKEKQLQFEIRVIRAKYTGMLNDNGTEIAGEYALPGFNLPLVFKRPAAEIKTP